MAKATEEAREPSMKTPSKAARAKERAERTLNREEKDSPQALIDQAVNAARRAKERKTVEPPKKSDPPEAKKPRKTTRKTAKQREQEAKEELKAAQKEIEALRAAQEAQSEQEAQDVQALKLTVANMVHSLAIQIIDARLIPQKAWPLDYREQTDQHRALNQAGVAAMDYFLPDDTINPGIMYAVALGGFVLSNREQAPQKALDAPPDRVPPPTYRDGPAPEDQPKPDPPGVEIDDPPPRSAPPAPRSDTRSPGLINRGV